jgi:integrase
MAGSPRGRPTRYAEFDALVASLPKLMEKRPKYVRGIGVYRGARGDTVWLKIRLPHGGAYAGAVIAPGGAVEIKMGRRESWSWDKLIDKHRELQGRADRREPLEDAAQVTFEECANDWLHRAAQRVKGLETISIHVRRHLAPCFGPKATNAITVSDVNRWVASQLRSSLPSTVQRQFNTLRAILNDAVRAGYLKENPCRHADPIRGTAARQRFLEGHEVVTLLHSAERVGEWLPDFILWCVHSGMRKGEVKALQWSDIRQLEDGRTLALVRTSKDGRPRIVHCTRTMVEVLARQRKRQVKGNERVFPITPMTLRRRWEAAREAAGLGDVTLHDLRRTHGTHAAAAGVDLRTLADRIGHADLTMLQQHYAAVVGTAAAEAADTFQHAFDRMMQRKAKAVQEEHP